ncbi:helix-turn-helix domain-containing protein [Moraxella canis]|uniref:helix-turn-helix domain-containing protein n=1 Tax=Moraxella canis TaxID=90239 RepID=UPI001D0D93E3|nr:helix-turn-helix transcriptional regulator [Moraxella canis]
MVSLFASCISLIEDKSWLSQANTVCILFFSRIDFETIDKICEALDVQVGEIF